MKKITKPISVLLFPESAKTSWDRGNDSIASKLFHHYQDDIFVSLVLGWKIQIPANFLVLLNQQKESIIFFERNVYQIKQMFDLLTQTGDIHFSSFDDEVITSELMASSDYRAILENPKIQLCSSGGKTAFVKLIDHPGFECALSSGHSGGYQQNSSISNFVFLLHQRYGYEYVEPPSMTQLFSLSKYAALKNYLFGATPGELPSQLTKAKRILQIHIPSAKLVNHDLSVNFHIIENLLKIRDRYINVLHNWYSALEMLNSQTESTNPHNKANDLAWLRDIILSDLKKEYQMGLIKNVVLNLLTIPIQLPIISIVTSTIDTIDDLIDSTNSLRKIDFYFYVHEIATSMSET